MNFVAGVDGGGTKTTLICLSVDGKYEKKFSFGAFNINAIGADAFRLLVSEIVSTIESQGKCSALCIGAAGVSNREMRDIVAGVLKSSSIDKWSLVGDHEIALMGAMDGQTGIIVISGTGSIVFGKSVNGDLLRLGGWGHLIGDEGSAYGLSHDAFVAVSKMIDNIGPFTILGKKLGINDRSDLISYYYSHDKAGIASNARYVLEAAEEGDATAKQIIEKNAQNLGNLIGELSNRLGAKSDKVNVSFFGGLIENDTLFRKALTAYINSSFKNVECISPIKDAAHGAAMMALNLANEEK